MRPQHDDIGISGFLEESIRRRFCPSEVDTTKQLEECLLHSDCGVSCCRQILGRIGYGKNLGNFAWAFRVLADSHCLQTRGELEGIHLAEELFIALGNPWNGHFFCAQDG